MLLHSLFFFRVGGELKKEKTVIIPFFFYLPLSLGR